MLLNEVDGHLAGHVAGLVTAYSIGHYIQPPFDR
jgi:hypothetical protein